MQALQDFIIHYTSHNHTLNLLLIMALVWTTGVVSRKLHQPPILGELLAGIIFGPSLLGLIQPDQTVEVLSEFGVFFLMFYAGLETNPDDLKNSRKRSTFVGIGGFIIPFLVAYGTCKMFGLPLVQSLFISLGLSITAIAVSARVLHDLGMSNHRVTPVIIGASIIDDVLSLAFFTAIIDLGTSDSVNWVSFSFLLVKVIVFFSVTIAVGIWLFPKIGRFFGSRESKGFTFAIIIALLFGFLAELAELHLIIGAYLAGLFVRDGVVNKELFQKINDRFVSITYGFLGPVFFVSLSFHVTFGIFQTHLLLIVALFFAAVIGKVFGAGIGAYAGGLNVQESAVVGFAMNGRGAVELVVASVGLKLGVINDEIFSILVFIAFITTIMPPVSIKMLLSKTNYNICGNTLDKEHNK